MKALLSRNDLELYDTAADPDEMQNLAFASEDHKEKIPELIARLNGLIDEEARLDDGSHMPGPLGELISSTAGCVAQIPVWPAQQASGEEVAHRDL